MTIGDHISAPSRFGDITAEAHELVAGLVAEPWGQVSPSVYETGRLVVLAPNLAGHVSRVDHLLDTQRLDGGWGAQDTGYALVPTLSATDALLSVLLHTRTPGTADAAARRGLDALFGWLCGPSPGAVSASDLPDLPAIELIVPSLIASINQRLRSLQAAPAPGVFGRWPDRECVPLPDGMRDTQLTLIRARLASGGVLPQKLLHALEIAGDAVSGHPAIRPEATGAVGASPAATAAWLGDRPARDGAARRFLEAAARPHGGPVPCGLPITRFERAWVLGSLARAGVAVTAPAGMVAGLAEMVGPTGTAAADGLPPDADTTAGVLYALALMGAACRPDSLWAFETDTHFATWPGEDGVSVTTNAHVLEAFGQYQRARGHDGGLPNATARRARTIAKVSAWLRDQQHADGSWHDRWHASPYYATACAAPALHAFGGRRSAPAVDRAVRWVLTTQRADGSWGHWMGTAEETAYAVQVLLLTGRASGARSGDALWPAVIRGRDHLLRSPVGPGDPPLWHDKDLYLPTAIVRAAVLAALYAATAGSASRG